MAEAEEETQATVDDLLALNPSLGAVMELVQRVVGYTPSLSVVPPPADPREAWRARAAEYEAVYGEYKGPEHWKKLISTMAATGSLSLAARLAGVTLNAVSKRRERYACFAERLAHASEYFNSAVLERAAVVRAVDGVLRPVFHKGMIVGHVVEYSDSLMVKLLEGGMPEKYKPRALVDIENNTLIVEGGLPDMPTEPNPHRVIDNPPQPAALPPADT